MKMTVNNFAASCSSHYTMKSIVMSFKIGTSQWILKGFEEKACLKNIYVNNRFLHLDAAKDVRKLHLAKEPC